MAARPSLVIDGKNYNNDTLSCFLKPGYTFADIAKDTASRTTRSTSASTTRRGSSRCPWSGRATGCLKKYIAIKTFAPVFLTDETVTSGASATNGLTLNPAGKVQSVQIFGFNEVALPIPPNSDTTDYQDGTRKVIRLIN